MVKLVFIMKILFSIIHLLILILKILVNQIFLKIYLLVKRRNLYHFIFVELIILDNYY